MHLIKLNKISLAFHLCSDAQADTIFIILDGYSIFFQPGNLILTMQKVCIAYTTSILVEYQSLFNIIFANFLSLLLLLLEGPNILKFTYSPIYFFQKNQIKIHWENIKITKITMEIVLLIIFLVEEPCKG